jgi:hypothetical protein
MVLNLQTGKNTMHNIKISVKAVSCIVLLILVNLLACDKVKNPVSATHLQGTWTLLSFLDRVQNIVFSAGKASPVDENTSQVYELTVKIRSTTIRFESATTTFSGKGKGDTVRDIRTGKYTLEGAKMMIEFDNYTEPVEYLVHLNGIRLTLHAEQHTTELLKQSANYP